MKLLTHRAGLRLTGALLSTCLMLSAGAASAQETDATPAEDVAAPAEPAPAAEPEAAPEPPPAAPAETVEAPAMEEPAPLVEEAAAEAPAAPAIPNVRVGGGLRTEWSVAIDDSAAQQSGSHRFASNLRPYMAGQVHEYIKFEGNADGYVDTAAPGASDIHVLDAVLKFEVHDLFNVWFGRFLPPSDRANLSGPYFQNAWNYPIQSNLYPSILPNGRSDGIAYWGQVGGGMFKWQLGLFDNGKNDDTPLFAARVVLNVLDPESGYYNSSTYYGGKDVLAIGASFQHENDTAADLGLADPEEDDSMWNIDFLYENTIGGGVLDLEASYYNFEKTAARQGQSFWVLASFMLPGKQGPGSLQPMVRYQQLKQDEIDAKRSTIDGELKGETLEGTYETTGAAGESKGRWTVKRG
jgi:hypothetical protein